MESNSKKKKKAMLKMAAFQKHSVDINIRVGVEVIFGVGVGVKSNN